MTRQRRLRSIEGARGVAAAGVLIYHAVGASTSGLWLADATSRLWLGVPLFFLLSGFLLFRPFAYSIIRELPRPSICRYARARVLRIVPAYWTVLVVLVLVQGHFLMPVAVAAIASAALCNVLLRGRGKLFAAFLTPIAILGLVTADWSVVWPGFTNFFLVDVPLGPWPMLGPAWTLCIEASFYVALPILVLVGTRVAVKGQSVGGRAVRLAAATAVLIPIGVTYLSLAGDPGSLPGHSRQLPVLLPGYFGEFAVGMLLAIALEVWPQGSVRASRLLLAVGGSVGVLANAFLYTAGPAAAYGNGSSVFFDETMTVAFALVLASVLIRGEATPIGRALASRLAVGLGTISYGIYLWHGAVYPQMERLAVWGNAPVDVGLLAAVSVAFATASWFLIERPALRLKGAASAPVTERAPTAPPVAGMAI